MQEYFVLHMKYVLVLFILRNWIMLLSTNGDRANFLIPCESIDAMTQLNCLHFGGFFAGDFCGIFSAYIWRIFLPSFLFTCYDFFSDIKWVQYQAINKLFKSSLPGKNSYLAGRNSFLSESNLLPEKQRSCWKKQLYA